TISYTWRDNGQANTRTEPGSVVTTFGYDSYGRPVQIARSESGGWNDTTDYTYDSSGRINKQTFGNGTYEQYGYDSRSRLYSVTLKNSSNTTLRSQTMNYDPVGNLSSKSVDSVTTSYAYDDIDQLLSETRSGWSQEYTYDWNGNRLTKKLNGTTVQNFSYDSSDKLVANAYGTITYDAAGRPTAYPTASGTRTFQWDYDSRLTGMSAPGSATITTTHSYNGMGARVGTSTSSWSRTDLRSGTSVLAPVVSSSSGSSSQAAKYVPGVAERRNGVDRWNHAGLSNTDSQTGSSQSLAATREYDAYGNIVNSSGTFNGPFGYAGKFGYDSGEGSLQLVGHRWYIHEVGRFVT
ncbi:MAG: hypothetical protein JNM85_05110, partial [Chthonomonas sp.]|nr:hypothetical protein [Chthonomonas sp.]